MFSQKGVMDRECQLKTLELERFHDPREFESDAFPSGWNHLDCPHWTNVTIEKGQLKSDRLMYGE